MHDADWYKRFVEESTYLQRAGASECSDDKTRWFRERFTAGDYDKIIQAAAGAPQDPVACAYESMVLAAQGRFIDAIVPVLRGLKEATDSELRATLYNLLACRIFQTEGSDEVAEIYALKGWRGSRGATAWPCALTAGSMKLFRVRDGREEMGRAVAEINSLMKEVVTRFGSSPLDETLVAAVHRQIELQPWVRHKDSAFRDLFGHVKPK